MKGNKKQSSTNFGFTLIELLVVISIIGILASLSLVSFNTSQKQARDSQRKSDIKQYATAVENYANQNRGFFPVLTGLNGTVYSGVDASGDLCTELSLTGCPKDPKEGSNLYKYSSDGTPADLSAIPPIPEVPATKYVLWAKLESSSNNWVFCSNGKVGAIASFTALTGGGVCPL